MGCAKLIDNRTEEQYKTHTVLIAGTDKCLSYWGGAEGGRSIAIWACTPQDSTAVWEWVSSRDDMQEVRTVGDPYHGNSGDHVHIYCVHDNHPALQGDND